VTPAWRRNDSGGSTPTQGTVTAVAGWRPAQLTVGPQAGKDHEAQRSGPRPGNEVFALLGRTGTGQCLVAVVSPRSPQPVSLASPGPTAVPPSRSWSPPRPPSFQRAPPSKERSPSAPCPFAFGEASGSERLRLPRQVSSQPTHPIRQDIVWHREVCGDVAVTPAVYNPALQQDAIVCGHILEEDAKSVTSHGLHWGDLGRDGHQIAVPPWCSRYSSSRQTSSGPRNTWNYIQAQGKATEVPERVVVLSGDRFRGGWGFLGILAGREWGYQACSNGESLLTLLEG
jgi:hypothetical protein